MIHCVFLTGTEPFQHLKHSLDIWHKAKKLAFMLGEKAKKASNKRPLALDSASCEPFLVLL